VSNETGFLALCIAARELRCATPQAKCLLLYYAVNSHKDYKFFKSYTEISIETGLDGRLGSVLCSQRKFAVCPECN